ncbi:MAG: AI-2E family transporter [Pseudomonadota bacterium]
MASRSQADTVPPDEEEIVPLPVAGSWRAWIFFIALFLLVLWLLRGVLLPFVVSIAIAYLADPLADRLERLGLSRTVATFVLMALSFVVMAAILLLGLPLLIEQFRELGEKAPSYFATFSDAWHRLAQSRLGQLVSENETVMSDVVEGLREQILAIGPIIIARLLNGGAALLNLFGLLFVTPIVAFYLLLDWDRLVGFVDSLLPKPHAPRLRIIAGEIDEVLSGFVRGMGTVCMILSVFYAAALAAVGLPYALVIGLTAGMLTFVPFVGMLIGLVLSVGVALFEFWGSEPLRILVVIVIFVAGQVIEGNFLTPKLVGDHVRLHPIAVMFSVLAFGALFGFAGMLLSIPIAATLGVLARHGVVTYRQSRLYRGEEEDASPSSPSG